MVSIKDHRDTHEPIHVSSPVLLLGRSTYEMGVTEGMGDEATEEDGDKATEEDGDETVLCTIDVYNYV